MSLYLRDGGEPLLLVLLLQTELDGEALAVELGHLRHLGGGELHRDPGESETLGVVVRVNVKSGINLLTRPLIGVVYDPV